jgi:enoyl-CoA hydratase/carnithine racemase
MPGAGGTQRLPRLIGMGRAKEMILSELIDAPEAQRIGLVNRVVPRADLAATVQAVAVVLVTSHVTHSQLLTVSALRKTTVGNTVRRHKLTRVHTNKPCGNVSLTPSI